MLKSKGFKFFIVGALVLLMCIPLGLVGGVIKERANYSQSTKQQLSQEWGGSQSLRGAILKIPVTGTETRSKKVSLKDAKTGETRTNQYGSILYENVEFTETVERSPMFLLPADMNIAISTQSETRKRGIFEVPVYRAKSNYSFGFDTDKLTKGLVGKETLKWDLAELIIPLSQNRSLRGNTVLLLDGEELQLEPRAGKAGLTAKIGDPRKIESFKLSLNFLGAQSLFSAASGGNTTVTMQGDWAHPSFTGAYLPDSREVTVEGFSASWEIPHVARSIPQLSRTSQESLLVKGSEFGVKFFQPNDFYQTAYRAGRYGILFIALTFLTILLLEKNASRPIHPVQYLMVGVAQSMFVLLMVSFAEQIGFGPAYIVASLSLIGLITLFAFVGLKLGRQSWLIGGALTILYAVLYLILRSTDYALLAGSVLCFAAIAAMMMTTRNEDWYGLTNNLKMPKPRKKQQASV